MSLAGDWYNELGSSMHLEVDPDGTITGKYVSAAGEAAGSYTLVGRYDTFAQPGHGTALGWTVSWRNSEMGANSVTSWSGQYQDDEEERIAALWLLTVETRAAETWESTFVGQDVFTRTAPALKDVERRLRLGRPTSHPLRHAVGRR